jgi:hypothetical protein
MIMTFDDEFNTLVSSPNGEIGWMSRYTYGRTQNYEVQYYSDPSVGVNPFSVKDGVLTITAAPADPDIVYNGQTKTYTSGVLTTYHSFAQLYGYFEIRADLPAGKGFWPAFWMLPADNTYRPEIDVFEQLGNNPDKLYYHLHSVDKTKSAGFSSIVPGASTGFHTYAVDWEPDTITWLVDGKEVAHTANTVNTPMYMLVNLAVGGVGSWPGPADGVSSATFKIDYIRAYASPHTLLPAQVSGNGVTGQVYLEKFDMGAGVNYAAGSGDKIIDTTRAHSDYVDLGSGANRVHLLGGNDTVKFGSGVSRVSAGPGQDTFIFDNSGPLAAKGDTILYFKEADGSYHDTIRFENFGPGAHLVFHGNINGWQSWQNYDVVDASGHVDLNFTIEGMQKSSDGTYHHLGPGDVLFV